MIGGEVPNLTVTLDSRVREASRVFALDPPIGARRAAYARRRRAAVARFVGVVDAIDLDDRTATLLIKA